MGKETTTKPATQTSQTPLNILISGAGIASSVFCFWLLRGLPNAHITIVERDPTPRLTGASIDIRSSGVDIIKWMGLEPEIKANTTNETGARIVRKDGSEVATFYATGRSDMQSMTSEYEIFRGKLADIFFKPVLDKVRLISDEVVEDWEEVDDGVVVTLKRTKEKKKYDLFVAADGIGSKTRGKIMGTNSSEQVADGGLHIAYFTIEEDLLKGSTVAQGYSEPGCRTVFIRPDPDPAGKCRANLLVGFPDPRRRQLFDDTLAKGHEAYMALLEETFSGMGWITKDVLKGMRTSPDFYASPFAQVRSPKLVAGRVALIGDSGHATPGMGTSLAIISGYVLAGELLQSTINGDVLSKTTAGTIKPLQRFEDLVLPFVRTCQGRSGNLGMRLTPATQWGIRARDVILGLIVALKIDKLVMHVAYYLGITEKKLDMPKYPWPEKNASPALL